MKKIQIIGFSGSGKSTLAGTLAERFQLPVLYLDTVFWLPGWEKRPREEQREILAEFLAAHPDGWVIDGNYTKNHYSRRMEEADQIIFMNFNRWRCLWRVLKRWITYQGKSRASMTVGCEEKIDLPFIKWVLWDSRRPEPLSRYRYIGEKYADKFVELKNPRQVDEFLSKIQ
ncbi:MAG: topology modulation protein [Firmicutes bacterium]|nr:topology modulation protein [Bacillota bacterium]